MRPVRNERLARMFSPACESPELPQCAPLTDSVDATSYDDRPKETDLGKVAELMRGFMIQWESRFRSLPRERIEGAKEDFEARQIFDRFYAEWNRDTATSSNMTRIITHPAYYSIIAMGKRALPYILKSLEDGGGPWFVALEAIVTDGSPVSSEHRNNARQMREDWLIWGRKHGYLEPQGRITVSAPPI
jgi:hypothetical protein